MLLLCAPDDNCGNNTVTNAHKVLENTSIQAITIIVSNLIIMNSGPVAGRCGV